LTKKEDVYIFGVLMLEILSGRSNKDSSWPVEQQFLLEMTWQLHEVVQWQDCGKSLQKEIHLAPSKYMV
jgi:hypothetical protein